MWHSFTSSVDITMNRVVLGFVETSWRYPFVTAGVLGIFLVLTAILWIEILRERTGTPPSDEALPLRLKR